MSSSAGDRRDGGASVLAWRDRRLGRQLGRYVVVGVIGYAVQVGSFALLVHVAGVPYVASAIAAGLLALLNNFVLNRHWTFEVGHDPVARQAWTYAVISALFFAAQIGILHVLVVAGVPKVLAEAMSVVAVVPLNFLAQRRFAFRS
jgi:putative flippase GtrA